MTNGILRKRLVVMLALTGLLVTACAGDPEPKTAPRETTPPTVNESTIDPPAGCTDATATEAAEVTAVSNSEAELLEGSKPYSFEPDCLIISTGQAVTLRNEDDALHSLTHRGGDFDQDIKGLQERTFERITEQLDPGPENEFYCRYHPGMVIYITVQ